MRKTILLLLFLLMAAFAASASGTGFDVVIPGPESTANADGLDPYNFINHFFGEVLLPLGLMDRLTVPEKAEIVKRLFDNLSDEQAVSLRIEKYDGVNDLVIGYRIYPTKDGNRALIMITNYDVDTGELITDGDLSTAYAALMYIRGNKLVPERYLYSKEREDENQGNLNNLADLYLFDDEPANDGRIEGLLQEYIAASDEDPRGKFIGLLTLSQYYISTRDFDQAADSLRQAHEAWQDGIVEDRDDLLALYTCTYEEYEVYSKYWQQVI